jgi:TonB family protein
MGRAFGVVLLFGFIVWISAVLLRGQTARPAGQSACEQVSADALTDTAVGEICAGDAATRTANVASDQFAKKQGWESAAEHYRRASTLTTKVTTNVVALNALADLYDEPRLNDFSSLELTLQELSALTPDDLSPMFRLARAQQTHGQIDAAEDTLLRARHRKPDDVEPVRRLAQFYLRLESRTAVQIEKARIAALKPDENGVYDVGGLKRIEASYPPALVATGVPGGDSVVVAVTLDTNGIVSRANIVQSIPELDATALREVSNWHFQPVTVNGQTVPARTRVLVVFGPPVARQPR